MKEEGRIDGKRIKEKEMKDTKYKASKKTEKARKRDRNNVNTTTNTIKKNNAV
jgi:hypothetical protein